MTARELTHTPLDELSARARAVRAGSFGARITYSPKVFVAVTKLCRHVCGYCTFARPPRPQLTPVQIERLVWVGTPAHPGSLSYSDGDD